MMMKLSRVSMFENFVFMLAFFCINLSLIKSFHKLYKRLELIRNKGFKVIEKYLSLKFLFACIFKRFFMTIYFSALEILKKYKLNQFFDLFSIYFLLTSILMPALKLFFKNFSHKVIVSLLIKSKKITNNYIKSTKKTVN